jgi:hypothetical protein
MSARVERIRLHLYFTPCANCASLARNGVDRVNGRLLLRDGVAHMFRQSEIALCDGWSGWYSVIKEQ